MNAEVGPFTVTVQTHTRAGRARRWAYVLSRAGEWPHVSAHNYHSEQSALDAGIADAQSSLAYERNGAEPWMLTYDDGVG